MRRFRLRIAGAVLAATLAGCSDTGMQQGTVPFKPTDTAPFNAMKNQMAKQAQTRGSANQPTEGSQPAAESKSAAQSKPATESKPAAESQKPAAAPKPAAKG